MNLRQIALITFFIAVFFILVFSYSKLSEKIPVHYWDEVEWVGRSYLFQFYLHGNFDRSIWDTFISLDQPTLAKFSYGAWLYPVYLSQKNNREDNFDYTKFLIRNGFYHVDEYIKDYHEYFIKNESNIVKLDVLDIGNMDYYVNKYGSNVNKTINLIYHARKINFIYLALAVLILSYFFFRQKGLIFAFIFVFFYGFNSLMVRNGIKAHSDGLFLLLFNISFVFILYYFLEKKNYKYLILFSFFVGLAMSTKLNGIMLYFIYIAIYLSFLVKLRTKPGKQLYNLSNLFIPLLISLFIFILLNPITYSNQPKKIIEMYKHRSSHTLHLSQYFSEVALPTPVDSIIYTFGNFFSQKTIADYNLPIFLKPFNQVGTVLLLFFLLGIYTEFNLIKKGDNFSLLIFSSFIYILLIMSYYLRLNWDRYFIHIVSFFIYYQTCGINLILSKIKQLFGQKNNL